MLDRLGQVRAMDIELRAPRLAGYGGRISASIDAFNLAESDGVAAVVKDN
jgi:hypothetical protein